MSCLTSLTSWFLLQHSLFRIFMNSSMSVSSLVAFISLSNMQPLGIGWFFDHTINVHSDIVFTVVADHSYLVQPNMWQDLFQCWSVHSVVGIFFNHPLNTVEKVFGIGDIIMSTYSFTFLLKKKAGWVWNRIIILWRFANHVEHKQPNAPDSIKEFSWQLPIIGVVVVYHFSRKKILCATYSLTLQAWHTVTQYGQIHTLVNKHKQRIQSYHIPWNISFHSKIKSLNFEPFKGVVQ